MRGGKRPIQSPPYNCSQEGTALFLPQKGGWRGAGSSRGISPHCCEIPPQARPEGGRQNYSEWVKQLDFNGGGTPGVRSINIFVLFKRDNLLFFHFFCNAKKVLRDDTCSLFSLWPHCTEDWAPWWHSASITVLRYSRYLDIAVVLTLQREKEREREIKLTMDQFTAKSAYLNSHTPWINVIIQSS